MKKFFENHTFRLSATYLVIIMLMSITFSGIFYNVTSSHLINRRPPNEIFQSGPNGPNNEESFEHDVQKNVNQFLQQRADRDKEELFIKLILINLGILALGSLFSYYLARKNLEPIEANLAAQERFVSDASHELRTPLTAIQTTNEVSLRDDNLNLKEAKELLASNIEEVKHLKNLTDSLLNFVNIENTQHNINKHDIGPIVTASINNVINKALEKNISIEDNIKVKEISCDPKLTQQLLVILLDNAIKYSPANSVIKLDILLKHHMVEITVSDNGEGIQDKDQIFDRFFRADTARTNSEGFGLGLSIAKSIVETHKGKISVSDNEPNGTIFKVILPKD